MTFFQTWFLLGVIGYIVGNVGLRLIPEKKDRQDLSPLRAYAREQAIDHVDSVKKGWGKGLTILFGFALHLALGPLSIAVSIWHIIDHIRSHKT